MPGQMHVEIPEVRSQPSLAPEQVVCSTWDHLDEFSVHGALDASLAHRLIQRGRMPAAWSGQPLVGPGGGLGAEASQVEAAKDVECKEGRVKVVLVLKSLQCSRDFYRELYGSIIYSSHLASQRVADVQAHQDRTRTGRACISKAARSWCVSLARLLLCTCSRMRACMCIDALHVCIKVEGFQGAATRSGAWIDSPRPPMRRLLSALASGALHTRLDQCRLVSPRALVDGEWREAGCRRPCDESGERRQ